MEEASNLFLIRFDKYFSNPLTKCQRTTSKSRKGVYSFGTRCTYCSYMIFSRSGSAASQLRDGYVNAVSRDLSMTGSDVTPPHGGDVMVALGGPLDERSAGYDLVTPCSSSQPCFNLSVGGWDDEAGRGVDVSAVWAVSLGAVMVSAVLGNLLVIASVLRYYRLRRVANSFIVSMAFADLLVAVLVMPFNASQVPSLLIETTFICL